MTSSKFATIHGGLLVRKGEAVPALRNPSSNGQNRKIDLPSPTAQSANASPPRVVPAPGCDLTPVPAGPRKVATGDRSLPKSKATVRLDSRQKHMMGIATAVLGRSRQDILSAALDGYLAHLGATELKSCGCFLRQLGVEQTAQSAEACKAKSG